MRRRRLAALFPARASSLSTPYVCRRNRRSGENSPSGVQPLDRLGYVHRLGEVHEVGDTVNGSRPITLVGRKNRREPVVTVAKDLPTLVIGHAHDADHHDVE